MMEESQMKVSTFIILVYPDLDTGRAYWGVFRQYGGNVLDWKLAEGWFIYWEGLSDEAQDELKEEILTQVFIDNEIMKLP